MSIAPKPPRRPWTNHPVVKKAHLFIFLLLALAFASTGQAADFSQEGSAPSFGELNLLQKILFGFGVIGCIISAVGGIMLLVAGFRTSAAWGIAMLLCSPFPQLAYLFTHREESAPAFKVWVIGVGITILSFISVGIVPNRQLSGRKPEVTKAQPPPEETKSLNPYAGSMRMVEDMQQKTEKMAAAADAAMEDGRIKQEPKVEKESEAPAAKTEIEPQPKEEPAPEPKAMVQLPEPETQPEPAPTTGSTSGFGSLTVKGISGGSRNPVATIHSGVKNYVMFRNDKITMETRSGTLEVELVDIVNEKVIVKINGGEPITLGMETE